MDAFKEPSYWTMRKSSTATSSDLAVMRIGPPAIADSYVDPGSNLSPLIRREARALDSTCPVRPCRPGVRTPQPVDHRQPVVP